MVDFGFNALDESVRKLNPGIEIFPVSAKSGEGMNELCDWYKNEIQKWNEE